MAVTILVPNNMFYQLGNKDVNFQTDTFKVCLMQSSFSFNPDSQTSYDDVSFLELPEGYGYTMGGKVLTGGTYSIDGTNNRAVRTFDVVTWTANGGSIGAFQKAILYSATSSNKTIICCIDCGESKTIVINDYFTLQGIKLIIHLGS